MSRSARDAVSLTPMRRRHLPGVLRIEGKVYPKPWSLGIFLSEIAIVQSRYYYVAMLGRKVVGYCGLMVSLNEGHITNIAVDPDQWGHGVATTLLLNAFEVAASHGVTDMTLEVRTSNRRAQHLYFAFGFQPAGIRKGYYQETNEDAIIMWAYDISSDESRQRRMNLKEQRDRRDAHGSASQETDEVLASDMNAHDTQGQSMITKESSLEPHREGQQGDSETGSDEEWGGTR